MSDMRAREMAAATRWLQDVWGVQGTLHRLPGFQDDNYRVDSDQGRFVLRISHHSVSRAELALQNRVMRHVSDALPGRAPLPMTSVGGADIERYEPPSGRFGRLLTFIDGQLWADARPLPLASHRSLGRFLGRLDRVLAQLEVTGSAVASDWDLGRAGDVVGAHVHEVRDRGRAALVHMWLQRWAREVAPVLAQLPRQVIHNDANDYNLLVAARREGTEPSALTPAAEPEVAGIIDFADALVAPRVAELAIAIAYAVQREFDVLACAHAVTRAYCAELPLAEVELAVLPVLVAMRLCTTCVFAARNRRVQPDNAYLQVSAEPAWLALEQWSSVASELFPVAVSQSWAAVSQRAEERLAGLRRRRAANLAPGLSVSYERPLHVVRGRGQYLFDSRGRAFLDCVNNVCHVGHCHPRVTEAAAEQLLALNTNTRYLHEAILAYTERLCATLPAPLQVCALVCSGSEANELALRMARVYTGARDVVVIDGAYHGNTGNLIAVSPYKFNGPGGAGPGEHVHILPVPDRYRGAFGYRDPEAGERYAQALDAILDDLASRGRQPALLMAESLLGCGGQIELPPGYLRALYRRVRAAGGLCLADEVQVGFGRVGSHFWGFQTQGVVPDIVTMGKPMGNGHPLAAVVTTRAVAERFANGMEYFNTFGGNPVSARIGASVLDVIEDEQLQAHASAVGDYLLTRLRALKSRHAPIGDVRGLGLFLGVELVEERASRAPAAALAHAVVERAKERGVLLSTDGPLHNVIKIKPPLSFSTDDADRLAATLDAALSAEAAAGSG